MAPNGITRKAVYADSVPVSMVAQFYGETFHDDPLKDGQRAQQLQQHGGFATAGAGEARSEQALNAHKSLIADKRDLLRFRDALVAAIVKAPAYLDEQAIIHSRRSRAPYDHAEGLATFLRNQPFKLDPRSGFHVDNQPKAGQSVSLLQFMEGQGWDRPVDLAELKNMGQVLFRRQVSRPPHGDLGGGLSWPIPLDRAQQQRIYDAVNYNTFELPEFKSLKLSQTAFGFLSQTVNWSEADLQNPRDAITKLLKTPAAQALGEALRAQFQGAGSAQEWALSALQIGLNPQAFWHPEEKNRLAGFDLSQREHWGKPLSVVAHGLTEHLRRSYGKNAPVAAYLLLSHHAPELLVKDIPDDVSYGSPAWVSLKSIVAKAEYRAPGSTAGKSYEQLLKDDLGPISAEEKNVEALAGREGLIHWAVADGAIEKRPDNNYSAEEIERASALAGERFDTLKKASQASRKQLATRKELALATLKAHFKAYGDIDFEKKVLMPAERERDLLGPYSMLDLYLDRPKHTRGYSQDSTVPFEQISEAFYRLAPINEVFEKNVTDYYAGLKGGADVAIKHLMSLLPEDDKKALEYGELSVYAEEDVTRTSHFANRVEQFSYESRQPDDNRSLLFVTTYQGRKTVYEVNPQQGFVRKRTDLSPDLKPDRQGEWVHLGRNKSIREIKAQGAEAEQRKARDESPALVQTFNSARTQYIADTVLNNLFKPGERNELVKAARGFTTFDSEVTEFEKIQAVTRALVPFASAIDRFQKGDVSGGLAFLGFDVFGFALGGYFAAGKIAGLGGQVKKAGGILARAAVSAANPFAGGKAIVSRGLPLHQSLLGKGTFSWKAVSTNRGVNRAYQDKQEGIAVGTYTLGDTSKITAKFDEVLGKWFAYDPKSKKRYGVPLEGFRVESSSA